MKPVKTIKSDTYSITGIQTFDFTPPRDEIPSWELANASKEFQEKQLALQKQRRENIKQQ